MYNKFESLFCIGGKEEEIYELNYSCVALLQFENQHLQNKEQHLIQLP